MGTKLAMVETNTYPGMTIRMFDRSADEIYTAFEETRQYLRVKENVFVSGNPVRSNFRKMNPSEAKRRLGFDENRKLIFATGGSLGAKKINQIVAAMVNENRDVQWLWQCGERYTADYTGFHAQGIRVMSFVEDMNTALNAADIIVARAGASTIAEITHCAIPAVLIPSPNVTENHQYYNAKSLSDRSAAVLIEEKDAAEQLPKIIDELLNDETKLIALRNNLKSIQVSNAAAFIVDRILRLTGIMEKAA
jgi:UDP-N-acetylglucosamine--N-acetylmuramyl-(pentapeptide) pyrophosphoryl-undecaprenol N-acetylglucosamine transferase